MDKRLLIGVTAGLLLAAFAEPAASQTNQPQTVPAATVPAAKSPPAAPAVKVTLRKVPSLGMATTERVTEAVPALPDGVGLVVQAVVPGSPAARAGLHCFDVLHKLNDQILINNPQFRVLLRTFKPGNASAWPCTASDKPQP